MNALPVPSISVVGPLNIDLIIHGSGPSSWDALTTWDGPADMEMAAAGSIGYTVQTLARLGVRVQTFSTLPDDALGAFIMAALENAGLDTAHIQRVAHTLGGIGVYMLLFGDRKRPLSYRLPTHPLWQREFTPDEREALLSAHALHCGGYLHHREAWHGELGEVYREARRRGLLTTMDSQFPLEPMPPPWLPALVDVLEHVQVLLCDDHEARAITAVDDLDDAARILREYGVETVVIKQGASGSTVYTASSQIHQPAVSFGKLVDSIGAGDAYDAAFIYGLLMGWEIPRCARFGAITAGFSVTGVGGVRALPPFDKLAAALEDHERRTTSTSGAAT